MSRDRIATTAARLIAARRAGQRISLSVDEAPRDFAEGFAIQDAVVAALDQPTIGWKLLLADGNPIFAPILASDEVPAGGTWRVQGGQPAGIEVEIAFRMGATVPAGATPEQILDAVASAHVVFELCQSRLADPNDQPRHVGLADCVSNAGVVVGDAIAGWRSINLRDVPGRLNVDGSLHKEGRSVDPLHILLLVPGALAGRGKKLEAGQVVITGSLVGMNWLDGSHDLEGVIEGCGRVACRLAAI